RDRNGTGVQACALPIWTRGPGRQSLRKRPFPCFEERPIELKSQKYPLLPSVSGSFHNLGVSPGSESIDHQVGDGKHRHTSQGGDDRKSVASVKGASQET